ncbi:MAG: BTAD domain-containing putative transcriptional regulator [Actinomycetota bacterium]
MTDSMFRVLGQVGWDLDGPAGSVRIGSPRARALLAMLVLADGLPVTPERLIGGIWGGERPQHPGSALQVIASRLRTTLAEIGFGLDLTDAGYVLVVPGLDSDLRRAWAAADEARAAFDAGDARASAAAAAAGLACWAGESLAYVGDFPFAGEATRRLDRLRLDLVGLRNRAYLRLGYHAAILADIDDWIALDPWREPLRTQQMLALHAEGRSVEAISVYSAFRDALVAEFGLEPTYDCRELHRAIVRDDPAILLALDSFRRLHTDPGSVPLGDDGLADTAIRLVWAARGLAGAAGVSVVGAEGDDRTWLVVEATGAAAAALRLAIGGRILADTSVARALSASVPVTSVGPPATEVGVGAETV